MGWVGFENHECHQLFQLQHFSTTNGLLQLVTNVFLLLFIIIANSVVVYGLLATKQTKSFTNRMFIMISIGDFLCGCIVIPLYLVNIYLGEGLKDCIVLSKVETGTYILFSFGSSLNIFALTLDRFLFIRFPFKYHVVTMKKRVIMLVMTTSFSVGITMVILGDNDQLFAFVASITILFVLTTSLVVNVMLVMYIRKQRREIRRMSNTFVKTSYKRRATKTVFILTIILVVTHLPQVIFLSYTSFVVNPSYENNERQQFFLIFLWLRLLGLLNAGLNALVFISRNKGIIDFYKKKFKLI